MSGIWDGNHNDIGLLCYLTICSTNDRRFAFQQFHNLGGDRDGFFRIARTDQDLIASLSPTIGKSFALLAGPTQDCNCQQQGFLHHHILLYRSSATSLNDPYPIRVESSFLAKAIFRPLLLTQSELIRVWKLESVRADFFDGIECRFPYFRILAIHAVV